MEGLQRLKGLRVLVVEDEALISLMVSGHLTDSGCDVVETVHTAAEALAAIEQHDVQCAMLEPKWLDGL